MPVDPPLQQPLGHEVASQTHWPLLLHSCPDEHAPHAAPPAAQDETDSLVSDSHVVPSQQPEQDDPPQVHAPLEHACPEPHAAHAPPPVPHCEADSDTNGTQAFPLQHPFGQDVASQTHSPLPLHSCPARQLPQLAPPVPQEDADSAP